MSEINFDGAVAIVTGGGRGIGKGHCLELARRGARVVVNDVSPADADAVVAEIEEAGGTAVSSYDSVGIVGGARGIAAKAISAFGTIDALVNNAGIMRNGMIEDVTDEELGEVLDVNLRGSYLVTQACWPTMKEKGFGRIVMTSSAGGLFAMQGEANYAASKGGVYGLCRALSVEGKPHGILVNTLLPMATTSLTASDPVPGHAERYPAWAGEVLKPKRTVEAVSPFVALMLSRGWALTGEAFSVGFGRYARVFVGETAGWIGDEPVAVTAEELAEHLDEIRSLDDFAAPADIYEEIEFIARNFGVERPA